MVKYLVRPHATYYGTALKKFYRKNLGFLPEAWTARPKIVYVFNGAVIRKYVRHVR